MSNNPSFVLQSVENVAYEDRPIPSLSSEYDVIVEVKKTGICGSDVHYLTHGRIGDFVLKAPMVLGHESSGVVSKVGDKVKHVKPGDRVAVEPGATCGNCNDCKAGRYNLCPDIIFAATPPYDGTLARYYRVPGSLVYPLPDHVSLEDGAMPTSILRSGFDTTNRWNLFLSEYIQLSNLGGFRANQSVVIFGCGPVGLLCMAVARALGAARIIAVDIVQSRLEFAKQYAGAEPYLPVSPTEGEARMDYSRRNAENMKKTLGIEDRGPKAIDLVIDASGAEVSIQTALFVVKIGGTYVQVGMGNPNITIDLGMVMVKELVFKGSFRYGPGDYALAIALVSQGKIDLKPLVTHRYPFTDAIEAFKATRQGKSEDGKGVIKVIISGPDVPVESN
ncbi:hypothetical protein AAF712_000006 [Marasmius tenuissimus]|uniref:Enoyl reductase (ER) domain-containing protein n=1 Tax=Marasmius tenuissimus TaxID=585030 RepID=A0ABR3AE93_9AGAR